MKILVTGGTGLVGMALQGICAGGGHTFKFAGSADGDLRRLDDCMSLFRSVMPDFVIHLAGACGSFEKHQRQKVELFQDNIRMNENVLQCCHEFRVRQGIFCSSYAAYDEKLKHIESTDLNAILEGKPRDANLSYGFAKKMEVLQIDNYNTQYGYCYHTLLPVNLFGENDNFVDGHFVPAMIGKFDRAGSGGAVHVHGSSQNRRYFLYAGDLARYILRLMDLDLKEPKRILCAPYESHSIQDVVVTIHAAIGEDRIVTYDNHDSVPVQTVSNKSMIELVPDFTFTPLEESLKHTIQHATNRGMSNPLSSVVRRVNSIRNPRKDLPAILIYQPRVGELTKMDISFAYSIIEALLGSREPYRVKARSPAQGVFWIGTEKEPSTHVFIYTGSNIASSEAYRRLQATYDEALFIREPEHAKK
jgi:GDP-L-fucose synthase